MKIKQVWYLGEALPAMAVGIILGPIAAKFIDSERWGTAEPGQTEAITLVSFFHAASMPGVASIVDLS